MSFPIGLAFLVGFASGFDVGVIVFSLSLGIYWVSDFLSLCLQSMWDYASFYSSSFCLFFFNSFPVPFVQCFMFSSCSIQCHEFQQCIWRRTLCWQSEWPRSTPSLFSSIPYSFAIAKDNVSPMKQSRQGVDLEKDVFFFRELIGSLLHSVCKCEHDNGSLLALNCCWDMEFDQGMKALAAPQKPPWATSVVMPSSCLKNSTRAITRLGRGYLDLAVLFESQKICPARIAVRPCFCQL